MKKLWKRCAAAVAALVIAAGTLGVSSLARAEKVSAAEDSVTVYISSQEDGTFLHPYGAYEVRADLAESYGYEDSVTNGVSALDVLVKAHELIFGEGNVKEYLTVSNGSVSDFFTEGTYDFGFTVDGEQPHSGSTIEYEGMPLSYEGYSVNQAKVGDGSRIEFFRYVDSTAFDYYAYPHMDGEWINNINAAAGSEISLSLQGIWLGWYGLAVDKEALYKPIEDAQMAWVKADGSLEDIYGATVDENGDVTISVSDTAAAGDQLLLTAYVSEEDIANYATPLIMPIITVNVTNDGEVTGTFEHGEAVTDGPHGGETEKPEEPQIEEATTAALENALKKAKEPAFEDEWQVLALARAGAEVPDGYYQQYYDSIVKTLNKYDGKLMEGGDRPTDYAKVILALTATGRDVTDVGGYDLMETMKETYEKKGGTANQISFALIAINAASENKNVKMEEFEEILLDDLLSMQNKDGGFSVAGSSGKNVSLGSDVDVTAMAIQALTPYCENEQIKAAIDDAVAFLTGAQKESGGYPLVESAGQSIIALTALDIDPGKTTAGKNDSILDSMMALYRGDGTFQYGSIDGANDISTEQGTCALVAYQRYLTGETSFYDMSDVEIKYVIYHLEDAGVNIDFEEGVDEKVKLVIEEVKTDTLESSLKEALKGLQVIYDITVKAGEDEVQVSGHMMTVRILLDPGLQGFRYYQVAYIDSGTIKERIEAKLLGDELVFRTDHLSQYAVLASDEPFPVADSTEEPDNPADEDGDKGNKGDNGDTGSNADADGAADKAAADNGEVYAYKTGDVFDPIVWIMLIGLSGAAIAVLVGRKRVK